MGGCTIPMATIATITAHWQWSHTDGVNLWRCSATFRWPKPNKLGPVSAPAGASNGPIPKAPGSAGGYLQELFTEWCAHVEHPDVSPSERPIAGFEATRASFWSAKGARS